jgi:hypothetical protein
MSLGNPWKQRLLQIAKERDMFGRGLMNPYGSNYSGGAMMGGFIKYGKNGHVYNKKSKKYGYGHPKPRIHKANKYALFVKTYWHEAARRLGWGGRGSMNGVPREQRNAFFAKVGRSLVDEYHRLGLATPKHRPNYRNNQGSGPYYPAGYDGDQFKGAGFYY